MMIPAQNTLSSLTKTIDRRKKDNRLARQPGFIIILTPCIPFRVNLSFDTESQDEVQGEPLVRGINSLGLHVKGDNRGVHSSSNVYTHSRSMGLLTHC